MSLFKGYCPAIITPMTKTGKKVNYEKFKELIDFQISEGAKAIVFIGTTGEPTTLSNKEKETIVKFAVEYVARRVPVIVGAGSNSTKEAVKKSKTFEKMGVDGILSVTPYYNKCTQLGLIKHFTKIAKSVSLPIIMYNVPSRTGVNMLPATVLELSKIKNIVGIKEASGNIEQMLEIIRICDKSFDLFSGDDALTLPALSIGGKGVISVAGNIIPGVVNDLCEKFFEGDIETAKNIQLKITPLIKALFCEVNPIPIKTAMNVLGLKVGSLRLPLTPMLPENLNRLKQELKNLKLL